MHQMNKFNILLLLVFLTFTLKAQSLENEGEVLLKSPTYTHASTDVLGNYVIVFQTSKQLEFSFFDSLYKKTRDIVITIPTYIKKDEIIGIQLQGDSCSTYFMNEYTKIITEINISRLDGFSSKRIIGQLAFTENYLKCVYVSNAFYILTATYAKSQIDIHKIHEGGLMHTTYQFDMPDLYKRLSTGNHQLNEDPSVMLGIDLVNYGIENNVKSARSTKKLYAFGNSIYFVFDDADYSHIIHFDLEKNKASYKKFQFSLEKGNGNSKKQGNSFLQNETLFRVTLNSEQLAFTIIDINEHVSHAIFYATPHNLIYFKNGPIIQENADDKERVIDDSKDFFEKMSKLNISIAANKRDSSYVVEMGSYDETIATYQNNNSNVSKPTFSIGVGMGVGVGTGMGMGMESMHNSIPTEP